MTDFSPNITNGYTVDVAPSDPSRIYVTAFASDLSLKVLLVSTDRGASWQQLPFMGLSVTATPYIAAVDQANPDKVYVRTDDWVDNAEFAARDGLIYSDDGGRSWNEVVSKRAKLFGFALSPDGATVLAGYGDPILPGGRTVDVSELGIYKASTGDFLFERIFEAAISCLRWTATGLYACVTQNHPALPRPGLGLGFAPDANFTIATQSPFTSLLDVRNVRGPLACTRIPLCAELAGGRPGGPRRLPGA